MTDKQGMSSSTAKPTTTISPAIGAAPAGRVSRAQIVAMGRQGSPWEYVGMALAALRVAAEDHEIRFLLAAAYGRLGLRTAAIEQIERLPAEVQGDGNVMALRVAMEGLGGDRVGVDELVRTARKGVEAIRGREVGAIELGPFFEEWVKRVAQREHFRTRGGDLVWRAPGDATGWGRFAGQREMAAGLMLEHGGTGGRPGYPPTYLVEGLDAPWVFARIYDATGRTADGHEAIVMLAQEDGVEFVEGLGQEDMSGRLGDARVRMFVGAGAGERVAAFVGERVERGVRAVGPAITVPTTGRRIAPTPAEIVAGAIERARGLNAELSGRVERMYAERTRAGWAERFAEARAGGEALRVMVTTSRYSTFLRHSAADLCAGLEEIGCRTRLFMEPDDHSLNEAAGDLRAMAEFGPDLVVVPNYLRGHLGGAYGVSVPMVAWVQDSMPHLMDARAGGSVGEMDFVVGNITEDMFQKYGYPRGRALGAPMAASVGKFHAGAVAEGAGARHECEIAYVSHHSETPEAMLRRRLAEVGNAPALTRALTGVLERLKVETERGIGEGPLMPRIRGMVMEELARAGVATEEAVLAQVMSVVAMPLADRLVRHRTLEWAAEMAREKGWRMNLYGRGWEGHPTLGSMARGELEHGEDLRACYQRARVHLHVSVHTAIHQRVFECAMSGGLAVCRLMADDLSHLEYLAGMKGARLGPPAVCDAWRTAGTSAYRYLGYRTAETEEGRRWVDLMERMGLGRPEFAWLNGIHAERLARSAEEEIDGEGRSIWDLWPDAAAVMFHDRGTMREVLTRAVEDSAWREEMSGAMGERAREKVSYAALARRMVEFVGNGLAGEVGRGGRWYDARERGAGGAA